MLVTFGNVIKDAIRRMRQAGEPYIDALKSSYRIDPKATNLVAHSGLESGLTDWANFGTGTITRSNVNPIFGAWSAIIAGASGQGGFYTFPAGTFVNGTVYDFSIWIESTGVLGVGVTLRISDGVSNYTVTGGTTVDPKRISVSGVVNTAASLWYAIVTTDGTGTAKIDELQAEAGDFPTANIHTDGVASTVDYGRMEIPAAALSVVQGGIAFYVKPNWGHLNRNGVNPVFWSWGKSITNYFFLSYGSGSSGSGLWTFERLNASGNDNTVIADPFGANLGKFIVIFWRADNVFMSLDGSVIYPGVVGPQHIPDPTQMPPVFEVGSNAALAQGQEAGANYFWLAAWKGPTTQDDIDTMYDWVKGGPPIIDPVPEMFPPSLRLSAFTGFNYDDLWLAPDVAHRGRGGRDIALTPMRDLAPWSEIIEALIPAVSLFVFSGAALVGDNYMSATPLIMEVYLYSTHASFIGTDTLDLVNSGTTHYFVSNNGLLLYDAFDFGNMNYPTTGGISPNPLIHFPPNNGQYYEVYDGAPPPAAGYDYAVGIGPVPGNRLGVIAVNIPARLVLRSLGIRSNSGPFQLPFNSTVTIDQLNAQHILVRHYTLQLAVGVILAPGASIQLTFYDNVAGVTGAGQVEQHGGASTYWTALISGGTGGGNGDITLYNVVSGVAYTPGGTGAHTGSIGTATSGTMELRINGPQIMVLWNNAIIFTYYMSQTEFHDGVTTGYCALMIQNAAAYVTSLFGSTGTRD